MRIFNKQAAVKISQTSNSNNPPPNFAEFRIRFFVNEYLKIGVRKILSFVFIVNNGKTMKRPVFYDNAHFLDLPKFDVPFLKKIQYLQIEQSGKGIHTNKRMAL